MSAYYNEHDPFAAAWLRNLIAAGHIAPGEVDERSIVDVRPDDLAGFTQCHFFAGIGVWSLALRQAGWPDDRPVFTGSCPCQPLSSAGQQKGHVDERHLWPAFQRIIAECSPAVVLGEQVASKDGREWLAAVRADLEALGYAVGAADLCAAGVGAPHIRQRLYWMADADRGGRTSGQRDGSATGQGLSAAADREPGRMADAAGSGRAARLGHNGAARHQLHDEGSGEPRRMADADLARPQGRRIGGNGPDERAAGPGRVAGWLADAHVSDQSGESGRGRAGGHAKDERGRWLVEADGGLPPERMADADRCAGGQGRALEGGGNSRGHAVEGSGPRRNGSVSRPGPTNGFWRDADWLLCRDGKWRPVVAGSFPLAATGTVVNRVGQLRGAGNALCLGTAQAFIEAVMSL